MASGEEVRLTLGGVHGDIDPRALQRAIAGLLDLLAAAGIEDWAITELREGSVGLAVAPRAADPDIREKFAAIVGGIDTVSDEQRFPDGWTVQMVNGLIGAAQVEDNAGVTGITLTFGDVGSRPIGDRVRLNAEEIARRGYVSVGSVRGRVHRWVSQKGRREVSLVDEASQRSIRVSFLPAMDERVRDAIGHEIRAWGELRRDHSGQKESLRLDDFEIIDATQAPATVEELAGMLGRDWTGGVGSVDAVRRQRGD